MRDGTVNFCRAIYSQTPSTIPEYEQLLEKILNPKDMSDPGFEPETS